MKICIVSMTNLFLCPYIKKYVSNLPPNIDLIYWNRHNIEEDISDFANVYQYNLKINENDSKLKKILYFNNFRNFCKKILKSEKYDRIIFLHNYMAILLVLFLQKNYMNKYLIDIRDYSYEHYKFFYNFEKKAIYNSRMAVISSNGYKEFLPKHDYVLCHNDPQVEKNIICEIQNRKKTKNKPIQISFIGLVRFFDQNKKLLDLLGNDNRFILAFYGQNSDKLKKYAKDKNIKNVIFKGRFNPKETTEFYRSTDIINNYYGNNSYLLKYALSNKLYYAAIFKIPILICENTYMETIAMSYGFGIKLNEKDSNCADKFYEYYKSMDKIKIQNGCNEFIENVFDDNKKFIYKLCEFLNNK